MMKVKLCWRLLFHSLGLGSLSAAIFLQILVLTDITLKGYFLGTETNQLILSLEVFLTIFALIYFVYLYQRIIRSFWRRQRDE